MSRSKKKNALLICDFLYMLKTFDYLLLKVHEIRKG